MNFSDYFKKQLCLHPSIQPQDVTKLCYQAAFGAEHLLLDTEKARLYFYREYTDTPANHQLPLYEQISKHVCRINLAAWKAQALPPDALFEKFTASAQISVGSKELFLEYLATAEQIILQGIPHFTPDDWTTFLTAYKENGMPAVHHSEAYRLAEHPAYRIIRLELLPTELL